MPLFSSDIRSTLKFGLILIGGMHLSIFDSWAGLNKLKLIKMQSYICFLSVAASVSFQVQPVYAQTAKKMMILPTVFVDGRFTLQPITNDGVTINLLTATGGNGALLARDFVRRVHWPKAMIFVDGKPQEVTSLHELMPTASIPLRQINNGRFTVIPTLKSPCGREIDGFLGQHWFADQVLTFDYPGRQMLTRDPSELKMLDSKHRVALGFKTDAQAMRTYNFPRIPVVIDGQPLDLLLDTGATVCLSSGALKQLADGGNSERATSFIGQSIFDLWRRTHPEWRVIEQAETNGSETFAMILVPQITVGGYTVGPVWFTSRSDAYFTPLAQFLDKPVVGALGGTALQYFRMSIDYPNAVAVFERP